MKGPEVTLLIGVDHRIQFLNDDCGPEWTQDIRHFQAYLVEQARTHKVDLMAEEFSTEMVLTNRAHSSAVQEAAAQISSPHLFCDPDTSERRARAIENPRQREGVWLERLRASGGQRVLFVCGDDHVDSFAGLLATEGLQSEVLSRDWGQNWRFRW